MPVRGAPANCGDLAICHVAMPANSTLPESALCLRSDEPHRSANAMKAHHGCVALLSILTVLAAAPASAAGARIYVTDSAADTIHVIDPATNKVVQVIKGVEAPHGVTFSPDAARVYVSNESDSTLDVLERRSGKLIKKVALSGRPNNIAITNDGGRVVVCIRDEPGMLDLVDTSTLALKKSVAVKGGLHNVY